MPPLSAIGNLVWLDRDGNGVQGAGEPGLAGVRVFVDANHNGTWDAGEPSAVTDADGVPLFIEDGIPAGEVPHDRDHVWKLLLHLFYRVDVFYVNFRHRSDISFP